VIANEERDARLDERIVRALDEAHKGTLEYIAHAPFCFVRSCVRLKRPSKLR
jgi:hypothetical protein